MKNTLYTRWIRSKGTPLEASRYDEYRSYRSKLRDLQKDAKTIYHIHLFEKVNGDARRTWGGGGGGGGN